MPIYGTATPVHEDYLATYDPAQGRGSELAAYGVANRAYFSRARADHSFTATKIGFALGTTSGNFDIGVYSKSGSTVTKLYSSGSTPCGTTNTWQEVTLGTPLAVIRGTDYFLTLALDNTTATVMRVPSSTIILGATPFNLAFFKDTAFPLGTSHASVSTSSIVPLIALY